jgi:hypothetical protein
MIKHVIIQITTKSELMPNKSQAFLLKANIIDGIMIIGNITIKFISSLLIIILLFKYPNLFNLNNKL